MLFEKKNWVKKHGQGQSSLLADQATKLWKALKNSIDSLKKLEFNLINRFVLCIERKKKKISF